MKILEIRKEADKSLKRQMEGNAKTNSFLLFNTDYY